MKFFKVDALFLRSKVARRIFFLFVVCALVPIGVLAYLTINQVSKEFNQKALEHLHQMCRTVGRGTYERLLVLESHLSAAARDYLDHQKISGDDLSPRFFKGIFYVRGNGQSEALFGERRDMPALTPGQMNHLASGKSLMVTRHNPGRSTSIFMARLLDPKRTDLGIVCGLVSPYYLWGKGGEDVIPPMSELFILDESKKPLLSSLEEDPPIKELSEAMKELPSSGHLTLSYGGEEYLSYYWNIFLEHRYHAGQWTVVAGQSTGQILAPLKNFKETFILLFLLTLWVVVFLSISQIRRNLVPIERLREGTIKVARGELDSRVEIKSGDEFEELGNSFNTMAEEIKSSHEVLVQAESRLRSLSSSLIIAQENERKRISKELHDDLGQLLTAVLLDVRKAADSEPPEASGLGPILERIKDGADEALKRVRSLSSTLRPGVLDHLGLEAAADTLLDDFRERTDIDFVGNIDMGEADIPEPVTIAIYRILQEAITNIVKHAKAKVVQVELASDARAATLSIKDDGVGFDPESLSLDEGIGLLGMKERAEGLGGAFFIVSAPGRGTEIRTEIPLSTD